MGDLYRMSDCPEDFSCFVLQVSSTKSLSSICTSSGSTSGDCFFPYTASAPPVISDFPLIVSSVSKVECCGPMSHHHHHHETPFPTVDGQSCHPLLQCLPLVPALVFVCTSLKDLTFNNLSLCNLLSMATEFSE